MEDAPLPDHPLTVKVSQLDLRKHESTVAVGVLATLTAAVHSGNE